MAGFLGLPREIRDMVYRHYVAIEGGYICDTGAFVKGTLKQANGRPIDMALACTCKRVAAEMDGLALRTNPITFSTLSGAGFRGLAQRFYYLMESRNDLRRAMLQYVGKYMTQEAYDKLAALYPRLTPLLDALRAANRSLPMTHVRGPYGEAPSVFRSFVRDVLQITYSCNKQAVQGMKQYHIQTRTYLGEMHILSILHCSIKPWAVPSVYDMRELNCMVHGDSDGPSVCDDGSEWRLSAAAAAIYFLQCLPGSTRAHVRRLIIEEDREAVPYPASHGRGFIPFCKENPLLRVERRANLWRNVFQPDDRFFSPRERYHARREENATSLDSTLITHHVGSWIVEATALIPAGMPPSSYSLVLDGNPVPQLCTRIFQSVVQRDVAWQTAWTESVKNGSMPEVSWFLARGETSGRGFLNNEPHFAGCYFYEDLPQALKDMSNGDSVVSCNFDPGEPVHVDRLVHEHRNWTMDTWIENWPQHNPAWWDTEAPLPSWMDILKENIGERMQIRPGYGSFEEWCRYRGYWR